MLILKWQLKNTENGGAFNQQLTYHIHSDSKKRRSFVALLFAAGDVKRSVARGRMIETNIINQLPMIVHHRVKGPMSVNESMIGVADALSVVKQAVSLSGRLHLILDMRGYIFDSLDSHKIWKTEFTQNILLSEHVECVAAIGDPGPKLIAEKELMESDKLKFFTDFNLAFQWLCNQEVY